MRCYISGAITGVKHADKLFARAEEKGTPIWQIAIVTVLTLGAGVLIFRG